jgi:hypothetical protein
VTKKVRNAVFERLGMSTLIILCPKILMFSPEALYNMTFLASLILAPIFLAASTYNKLVEQPQSNRIGRVSFLPLRSL